MNKRSCGNDVSSCAKTESSMVTTCRQVRPYSVKAWHSDRKAYASVSYKRLFNSEWGYRISKAWKIMNNYLLSGRVKIVKTTVLTIWIILNAFYGHFSKAFDKVTRHKRLLCKLSHYGIQGHTNKWIENFLKDRQQSGCLIEEETSHPINILSGVLQGSVLGPCLLLCYINDT